MTHRYPNLAGFPVVTSLPLQWGDQDAFGHVNNTVYLRWAETGRIDYMIQTGMWPEFPPQGIGPILASIKCDYRFPMTYPDTAVIGTKVVRIGNSSLRMDHRILSGNSGEIAAEFESTIVMLDYSVGKPVRVPDEMRQAVERIEGTI